MASEGRGLAQTGEVGEKVSVGAEVLTLLLILSVITVTFLVGYGIWLLLDAAGYSLAFGLPPLVRLLGAGLILLGLIVAGSTTRYRKAREILDSTAVTLRKLLRVEPVEQRGARTEPFRPAGPYRYVRNPMYFGVVSGVFGFCVLLSSGTILLWDVVVTLWFAVVLIPFEEKELDALFGQSYRAYRKQVPMLFPTGRRFRAESP